MFINSQVSTVGCLAWWPSQSQRRRGVISRRHPGPLRSGPLAARLAPAPRGPHMPIGRYRAELSDSIAQAPGPLTGPAPARGLGRRSAGGRAGPGSPRAAAGAPCAMRRPKPDPIQPNLEPRESDPGIEPASNTTCYTHAGGWVRQVPQCSGQGPTRGCGSVQSVQRRKPRNQAGGARDTRGGRPAAGGRRRRTARGAGLPRKPALSWRAAAHARARGAPACA